MLRNRPPNGRAGEFTRIQDTYFTTAPSWDHARMLLVGFYLGRYPSRVFAISGLHIHGASKPSLGSASHRVSSKVARLRKEHSSWLDGYACNTVGLESSYLWFDMRRKKARRWPTMLHEIVWGLKMACKSTISVWALVRARPSRCLLFCLQGLHSPRDICGGAKWYIQFLPQLLCLWSFLITSLFLRCQA